MKQFKDFFIVISGTIIAYVFWTFFWKWLLSIYDLRPIVETFLMVFCCTAGTVGLLVMTLYEARREK